MKFYFFLKARSSIFVVGMGLRCFHRHVQFLSSVSLKLFNFVERSKKYRIENQSINIIINGQSSRIATQNIVDWIYKNAVVVERSSAPNLFPQCY
jgi:hypothetical protein